MTQKKRRRCAIYTRKSTEEGLDQAFNSLDAQREACAAYALSQKSDGWSVLPTLYDDGGFSGGSMERPALARLLADVQSGRVDVVIVYKVDRLTRSLNDFARIVDVFDAAGVSFVSVTQQFNTTTSMGRLTLNVLLSFAQFEREVIAERVRDKIAQSKAKGMWMGGSVPFGYEIIDKKLIPRPTDARTVAHIYRRYLALPSVMALMEELRTEGIFNRASSEKEGVPFVRGPLHYLLSNPTYLGKVRHKDQIYEGQHDAIIDQALWDAVQEKRNAAIGIKRERGNGQHGSLLTGMIRDHLDRPMSPSHAVKKQRRYRYYVSSIAAAAEDAEMKASALRLPAVELERAVIDATSSLLGDERTIMALPQAEARTVLRRGDAAQGLATKMETGSKAELRQQLQSLGMTIRAHPDHIEGSISQRLLVALLDKASPAPQDDGVRISIVIPTKPDRRGHNLKLVLRSEKDRPPKVNQTLVALLAKAETARAQLLAGDKGSLRDRKLERVARLAFLAPDIVNAILEGRHPPALTTRRMMQLPRIPLEWQSQRKALGF
ncbi:MAG TPA: recombinase family protein [Sphingobium sp.]|nr:recombinase family protein [Sphingobium sp.]